jgi:HD-like signal output (HDOD) protein
MVKNESSAKAASILFVDDEANIVQGLKRMLYPMRNEWTMHFTYSAEEALNVLSREKIDIIVTDMRMPVADGVSLLKKVKELYPQTARIILSGYSEHELTMAASGIAHQYLSKPTNGESMKSAINRIISLRAYLNNQELIKIISGLESLPSLPELYLNLQDEINSAHPSIKKIGEFIAQDPTMTARVLQLVSSAFFGLPQKISNPVQAVNFLGLEVIKALVLFVQMFSISKADSKFSIVSFWNHSINTGRIAKKILQMENSSSKESDEAFIAGMLHDLGKLVLMQIPGYFGNVIQTMQSEHIDFHEAEYKLHKTSHSEAGAYLLGLWGLPQYLPEVLAYHHCPSISQITGPSILAAVHIADHLDSGTKPDENFIKAIGYKEKISNLQNNSTFFKNNN